MRLRVKPLDQPAVGVPDDNGSTDDRVETSPWRVDCAGIVTILDGVGAANSKPIK